jgi:23S rRNA (uracil1939-C5)-methyltransferase
LTISVSPGSELELAFTDVLANGQAVGRAGGIVIFCFGPLPNERARVRITAVKPKYAVAELLTILERSGDRVAPFCSVFGECGGCQLQHLAYPAQLAWKREVVRNALVRIGGFPEIAVAETIGMRDPRAYRNKMSLVVDRSCKRVGFYKQRSHDVVQIDGCPIVMPRLDEQIARVNAAKSDPATADAFARTRHVVARTAQATGEVVVTFTTDRPDETLKAKAAQVAGKLGRISGLTNSYDLSGSNAILGRKQHTLTGSATIEESVGGLRYRVSSGSFFQVNVEILERIFERVDPLLTRPLRILDLYCGAGTFSLFFARRGATVFGVDDNALAVAEARENAALNGLESQARFQTSTVQHALFHPAMAKEIAGIDAVFLDPPRKGCEERALAAIAARRIPAIWYLSCDPATLARDLKFLAAKGYRPGEVQPFDMFPQTGHVETLVLLAHS